MVEKALDREILLLFQFYQKPPIEWIIEDLQKVKGHSLLVRPLGQII